MLKSLMMRITRALFCETLLRFRETGTHTNFVLFPHPPPSGVFLNRWKLMMGKKVDQAIKLVLID